MPFFLSGGDGWRWVGVMESGCSACRRWSLRAGLLVVPDVPVATADAYGWIDDVDPTRGLQPRGSVVMAPDTLASWSDIARLGG